MLVPSLRDVVNNLKKGQVSAPVQTQYGWHVLRIEDERKYESPHLDKVMDTFRQQLQTQANMKAIQEIAKNAKIE